MAIFLLESFEGIEDPEDKYTIESVAVVNIDNTLARSGSQCLKTGYTYWLQLNFSSLDTGIIGFAYRFTGIATTSTSTGLIMFHSPTGKQIALHLDLVGRMSLVQGSTVLAYSKKALLQDRWNYIEVKWNCVNSIGADTFIVRFDGEEMINLPATTDCQAQASSGVTRIYIQGVNHASSNWFDDLYLLDLTGAAPNNDFLGDIQITALNPNGNGNTNDFTGIDADSVDNYLHVDETVPDWDTSYVESSTVSHIDLYTYEDLPGTPTIYAVQSVAVVKKDDASAKTSKLLTRVNGSNYEGSAFAPVNGTYGYFTEIWALNPDDSAAWAKADVDGAEFGIKVES
jgi:hypothetical protein